MTKKRQHTVTKKGCFSKMPKQPLYVPLIIIPSGETNIPV